MEISFSSRCMCIHDEKPISVSFYSFRLSTGKFTTNSDFSNILKSTVASMIIWNRIAVSNIYRIVGKFG